MEKALTHEDLAQFTGSEHWYRHGLNRRVTFTDGAKHVADHGGAYWLLDEIALAQAHNQKVKAEEFQVWDLTICPDNSAILKCEDGNGNVVMAKAIEYTDFPLPKIELWFANGVIYLPSEH